MTGIRDTTPCTAILVHGTWGRGFVPKPYDRAAPRWFEPGAPFRDRLVAALARHGSPAPKFVEHHWSGRNSIAERDAAGAGLADLIRNIRAADPAERIVLIGHSHGGNILLRAMARLGPEARGIEMATLATPFVELLPNAFYFRDNVIVTVGAILLLSGFALMTGIWTGPNWALSGALCLVTAAFAWRTLAGGMDSKRIERAERRSTALVEMTRHPRLDGSDGALLVVRGVDDEASLTLAAGAIVARLSNFLDRALWPFVIGAIVVFSLFPLVHILSMSIDSLSGLYGVIEPYRGLATGAVVALGAIFFLANLCVTVAPAGYGRELFLHSADIEINAQSVPDGVNAMVRTLARGTTQDPRLRHSIYDEPDCAEIIARWLHQRRK